MAADERKVGRCAEAIPTDGYMPVYRSLQGKAARDMYLRSRPNESDAPSPYKKREKAFWEQELTGPW